MTYPTTAPAQVIQIPVLGMNTKDCNIDMDPRYSPWLENVDIDGQKITARKGWDLVGSSENLILALGVHGDPMQTSSKLFAFTQGTVAGEDYIEQIDTGSGSFTVVKTSALGSADEAYPINYKNNLAFTVEAGSASDSARTADGTTWDTLDFTYSGSNIDAIAACEYKGRVYLMNESYIYYGALSAIEGATSRIDVSDFLRYYVRPAFLAVLSSPGDRPSETYLAIGTAAGEILVYGGDNPTSATWAMVGRYKVPPICGMRAAIEIDNDIWILTMAGVVSLRALMNSRGGALQDLSPSYYIQRYWVALMSGFSSTGSMYSGYKNVSAAYWPEKNKFYVFVPYWVQAIATLDFEYVDERRGTMLIYDLASKAWTIHQIPIEIFTKTGEVANSSYGGLTYFQNNLYFHCGSNVYRYDTTKYVDDCDPTRTDDGMYAWQVWGTHSTLGDPTTIKTVKGWNTLLKTDHNGTQILLRTIIDLGRITTAYSNPTFQDGISSMSFMNGGMGTVFQWKLTGETNSNITGPIELYSMGVIR